MKTGTDTYFPCMRWKQGEYLAVHEFCSNGAGAILPIIEIPEMTWDYEQGRFKKTLDDHLNRFVDKVHKKWGLGKDFFVDFSFVKTDSSVVKGFTPYKYVLSRLIDLGANVLPVVRPGGSQEPLDHSSNGFAIRASLEQLAASGYPDFCKSTLKNSGCEIAKAHLILDMVTPDYSEIEPFASVLLSLYQRIPMLGQWASVVILGTSMPSTMAGVKKGVTRISRGEWHLYEALCRQCVKNKIRMPNYGDYMASNPEGEMADPRLVKPSATIRYSTRDNWIIIKGLNVREHGFEQYRSLSATLIECDEYSGETFSWADKAILDCSKGLGGHGNLSSWRRVASSRQLYLVSDQLSSFHGT
jgi:Beta protein